MDEAVLHGTAKIVGRDPIRITTPPEQWAYAVAFPFRRNRVKPNPSRPLLIRVEATVEHGRIGVGCVTHDLTAYVTNEVERSATNGDTVFEVRVESIAECGWLVVRNTAPANLQSRVNIRAIHTFDPGDDQVSQLAEVESPSLVDLAYPHGEAISLTTLRSFLPAGGQAPAESPDSFPVSSLEIVAVDQLAASLGFEEPLAYPRELLAKPLTRWNMETDDGPIFRYLYRNFNPRRHLEFGTWLGAGALFCLEECQATVWTINLASGECNADGSALYSSTLKPGEEPPSWSRILPGSGERSSYQTDSGGFIGRHYREKGLGHRVCQIYCDSRDWDISNYVEGFFDSVLVDGGHSEDVVANDTAKALKLLRPGGLCLWHDFCPDPNVLARHSSAAGVTRAILANWRFIRSSCRQLFWIRPSWILAGVKAD